ncbi:MAG: cytochrome c [Pirellulales bacterium]
MKRYCVLALMGAVAIAWSGDESAPGADNVGKTSSERRADSSTVRSSLTQELTFKVPAPAGAKHSSAVRRGYNLLLNKSYLPPDFDQETFNELWKTWDEPLRSQAEAASAEERRRMAFARYGLLERPNDPASRPLQYVVDERGNWSMNCFACHQGKVAGRIVPGVPNSLYAMETLCDDVRTTKLRLGKKLSHMDLGGMFMPLGGTTGTTNAVMFGVALLAHRDPDLNLVPKLQLTPMTHHDHDAPPWWHFRRKRMLYIDGFAPKAPRPLMQFLLVKENGPEKFRQWETDFADIYTYLESLRPPKYPWAVDAPLAAAGEGVFRRNCSTCHGTYGEHGRYPEKLVPIDVVQTDRVRLDALTPEHRRRYGKSWFASYSKPPVVEDPQGYVAPPLDGIWASAPYFHNGSVPTLWHVLNSGERPRVWRRARDDGYARTKVGLEVETFDRLPAGIASNSDRRGYFDTTKKGKSAVGHRFPDKLSPQEKLSVLEYLKTL